MTFSQYAGIAIVPTLARLVLCAAFISAGAHKLFKDAEFDAAQAARLRELGVTVRPVQSKTVQHDTHHLWRLMPASYRQTDPAPPPARPPGTVDDQPAEPAVPPAVDRAPTTVAPSPVQSAPVETPGQGAGATAGPATARSLHNITLLLDKFGFRYQWQLAWLAALTELIGGTLLLVGLFSRIWGLGLSISMVVAFYLVSLQINQINHIPPMEWTEHANLDAFNAAFAQLGLFVLAFGIFLTGPGPLSLDRLLFGGHKQRGSADARTINNA